MIAPLKAGAAMLGAIALVSAVAAAEPHPGFDALIVTTKQALGTDPNAALTFAGRAEQAASSLPPAKRRDAVLAARRLRGEAEVRLGRLDDALLLLNQALRDARTGSRGSGVEADILVSLGNAYDGKGDLAAALRHYQAAYVIYQRIGDARNQALALSDISALYGDANDYVSALKYLDQALAAYRGDPGLLWQIYTNEGSTLQDLGRYREADSAYRKALPLARQNDSPLIEARTLGNIARVRLKLRDEPGASAVLRQAFALTADRGAATWRPQLVGIAAQAAYQRDDYAAAARLIAERFAGVDLATTTIIAREAHQTAYDTYRALGDAPRAVTHLAALKRLDDQATRLATSATAALASANFDFKNQELRLAKLQAEQANRKAEYERQRAHTERLIFLGVAGATAIIIALLTFGLATVRRSRNKVKAVAADLAVTNTALGKALAAKTEFLATTSHEIRTPLNGILGMTQVMLADAKLGADTRERVCLLHSAGVTMRALVDDILDVAKMETGNLTIEKAPFDLAATLTEASKLWAEQARGKGLTFVLQLDGCPGWVEGDGVRVRQIAFNLLSNALKFTAAGEVSLSVDHDADHYRLIVRDTGIGIAADKHHDIFESFKQADAGTTRQFGGTGLGLAICRNLAQAMGGEVAVDSIAGEGSTFTATLPLVIASREPAPAADGSAATTQCGVVIVDANPITRAMLKTLVGARCADAIAVASIGDPSVAGAALLVVDQNALGDDDALAALAAQAMPVVTLWKGEAPAAVAAAARVIAKPIGGPALITAIFDPLSAGSSLVQQAA